MPQVAFLYPLFLAGAAVAAVPIVLHLLRRDTTRHIPFSAVRFLKRAPVERARHRRLRELLLLGLRVAALLLLAFAFARPYFIDASGAGASAVTVVALDTSYSMTAPGRFAAGQRLAGEAIRSAPSHHAIAVIAFDDETHTLTDATADRGVAEQAVRSAAPSFGGTRYGAALGRAAALIGSRDGRIVVVTDLQRAGWAFSEQAAVPARITLEVKDVGGATANLAVQDVRRDGAEAVATIYNSGVIRVTSVVELSVDGRRLAETSLVADPSIATEVRFDQSLPSTGGLQVTVRDATGYEADNSRYLVLDEPAPPAVLLVQSGTGDGGTFYLSRALGATTLSTDAAAARFRVVEANASAMQRPGGLREFSAVVLLATQGLDRRGREAIAQYVQQGGGLFVVAGGGLDPAVAATLFEGNPQLSLRPPREGAARVTFTGSDPRHPVFRGLGDFSGLLGRAVFTRTVSLAEQEGARVLGRFSDGAPALMEYPVGAGRVIVFGSDLNNRWNNLPLQPIFVPFVHEVLRYLVGARELPSEITIADVPAGVARRPGVVTVQPGTDGAGTSASSATRRAGRRIAVNVEPGEADTTRMTVEEFRKAVVPLNSAATAQEQSDARSTEESQGYWRYGLLMMLAALVAEGLIGSRMV